MATRASRTRSSARGRSRPCWSRPARRSDRRSSQESCLREAGRPGALARAGGPAIAGVLLIAAALGVLAFRTVMRAAVDQVADHSVAPRERVGTDPGAQAPAFTAVPYRG